MGKPRGKRTLERSWRRWENNIKMDLQGVRWGGMNWIGLCLDRDKSPCGFGINLLVPQNAENFLTS